MVRSSYTANAIGNLQRVSTGAVSPSNKSRIIEALSAIETYKQRQSEQDAQNNRSSRGRTLGPSRTSVGGTRNPARSSEILNGQRINVKPTSSNDPPLSKSTEPEKPAAASGNQPGWLSPRLMSLIEQGNPSGAVDIRNAMNQMSQNDNVQKSSVPRYMTAKTDTRRAQELNRATQERRIQDARIARDQKSRESKSSYSPAKPKGPQSRSSSSVTREDAAARTQNLENKLMALLRQTATSRPEQVQQNSARSENAPAPKAILSPNSFGNLTESKNTASMAASAGLGRSSGYGLDPTRFSPPQSPAERSESVANRKNAAESSYLTRLSMNKDGYRPLGSRFDYALRRPKQEPRTNSPEHLIMQQQTLERARQRATETANRYIEQQHETVIMSQAPAGSRALVVGGVNAKQLGRKAQGSSARSAGSSSKSPRDDALGRASANYQATKQILDTEETTFDALAMQGAQPEDADQILTARAKEFERARDGPPLYETLFDEGAIAEANSLIGTGREPLTQTSSARPKETSARPKETSARPKETSARSNEMPENPRQPPVATAAAEASHLDEAQQRLALAQNIAAVPVFISGKKQRETFTQALKLQRNVDLQYQRTLARLEIAHRLKNVDFTSLNKLESEEQYEYLRYKLLDESLEDWGLGPDAQMNKRMRKQLEQRKELLLILRKYQARRLACNLAEVKAALRTKLPAGTEGGSAVNGGSVHDWTYVKNVADGPAQENIVQPPGSGRGRGKNVAGNTVYPMPALPVSMGNPESDSQQEKLRAMAIASVANNYLHGSYGRQSSSKKTRSNSETRDREIAARVNGQDAVDSSNQERRAKSTTRAPLSQSQVANLVKYLETRVKGRGTHNVEELAVQRNILETLMTRVTMMDPGEEQPRLPSQGFAVAPAIGQGVPVSGSSSASSQGRRKQQSGDSRPGTNSTVNKESNQHRAEAADLAGANGSSGILNLRNERPPSSAPFVPPLRLQT